MNREMRIPTFHKVNQSSLALTSCEFVSKVIHLNKQLKADKAPHDITD